MATAALSVHGDAKRVLVVDDSVVARTVIARSVDASDRFAVAGSVATSGAALEFLARTKVDVIVLDIAMPGIDGLTALPDLIAAGQGAKILIVSSAAGDGAAASVQALALGAADTLVKPSADALASRFAQVLIDRLEALVGAARRPVAPTVRRADAAPCGPDADYDIVAIGASTGGIHALGRVLRALPLGFRLPIVVTQHLPASFMSYFAAQLAVLGGRPCDVATDRMRIRAGRIVVAPGDAHLNFAALADGGLAIRLVSDRAPSGCMPSVDPMFDSLAAVRGARVLGVVLSGMGRDGADGARRLYDAGAAVVVQDQQSSVVWGMPGAVATAGCAQAVLSPEAIGALIASRRRPA